MLTFLCSKTSRCCFQHPHRSSALAMGTRRFLRDAPPLGPLPSRGNSEPGLIEWPSSCQRESVPDPSPTSTPASERARRPTRPQEGFPRKLQKVLVEWEVGGSPPLQSLPGSKNKLVTEKAGKNPVHAMPQAKKTPDLSFWFSKENLRTSIGFPLKRSRSRAGEGRSGETPSKRSRQTGW